jgi:hypothetical protein
MRTYAGDCENGSFEFLRAQGWNGGDLYKLAKTLGHANIKMTERYAKLGKTHIASTGNTARGIWKLMDAKKDKREAVAV